MIKWMTILVITLLIVPVSAEAITRERAPEVRIFSSDGSALLRSEMVYPEGFLGGVSVASCDVDNDGKNELITGAGPGGGPHVKVTWFKKPQVTGFMAYAENIRHGINVACGDVNGDGSIEIVTGARSGGGPHVRIFDAQTGELKFHPGFMAFDQSLRSGINVAVGDFNGDGSDEIAVSPMSSGGSHVRIFDLSGNYLGLDFFPFSEGDRGGVALAAANVDGGEDDELVMAVQRFGKAWVKVYKYNSDRTIVGEFYAFPEFFLGGVNLGAGDVDQDGYDEIIVAANTGGGPQIRTFEAYGAELDRDFFAYEEEFRGGNFVATGNVIGDVEPEIIVSPNQWTGDMNHFYKYIDVNLTEQRLYTYENGELVKTYLISSGINKYPTPEGFFRVYWKREKADMEWEYGPDHPDNYDLKDVPYVLSFYGGFTIHGAYWHNNFGRIMSHGCVNEPLDEAFWLYNWAQVGIPVIVHK